MKTLGRAHILGLLIVVAGCGGGTDTPDGGLDGALECGATECDDGLFCNGAESCDEGGSCVPGTPPCPSEMCDEASDLCDDSACPNPDVDGDGSRSIACGGADCDDDDPNRFPGNTEVCDVANVDEDCDPRTFGFRDQDMDGRPDQQCCNGETCGTDCDDLNPVVGMDGEFCDGLDNDCNGMVDDVPGGGSCSCTVIGETRDCGPDRALDGIGICQTGTETCAAGVWVCADAVAPAAEEFCNGLDDNCDGSTDESFECAQGELLSCTVEDSVSFPGVTRTCSVEGSSTCTALCEAGACVASSEDCDYCDDDGDGLDDEIGMTSDGPNNALALTGCEEVPSSSSADCGPPLIVAEGARSTASTAGVFFSDPVAVGYGPIRAEVLVAFANGCGTPGNPGGFALAMYRQPRGDIVASDRFGGDHSQTGAIFEVTLSQTSAGLRSQGLIRQVPSGAMGGAETIQVGVDGTCADGFLSFSLTVTPHSPIGPAGETTYRATAGSTYDESLVGPDLFPGDSIRVGLTAHAPSADSIMNANVFNLQQEALCPE